MTLQRLFAALPTGAALSVAGLLALSGCDERPYPSSANTAAPAAPPPADLLGAPSASPPVEPAPPGPAYAPPSAVYAPPPSPSYDAGAVVAMAPIPNPGAPGSEAYYGVHKRRVHGRYEIAAPSPQETSLGSPYGEGRPAQGRYSASTAPIASRPTPSSGPVWAKATHRRAATTGAATGATASVAAGAAAAGLSHAAKTASTAAAPVDRVAALSYLQTTLTGVVAKSVTLSAPANFTANQPADVVLTIPAGFADTLKEEAQKDGLADAAASAKMTALLAGDGFTVSPKDTQSAPLTAGQPTEFRWTVIAQAGAKGPLHADVGVDLLGGGSDRLALGSVEKTAALGSKLVARIIGASILVLIAALLVAWLARGSGPSRPASGRPAPRNGRPIDRATSRDEAAPR